MTAAELLTIAAPLLWAAVAEVLGQRSGTLNIGIEGVMLIGCFTAATTAPVIGPWGAVGVALLAGVLANSIFAAVVIAGADQVVAGTGMVLLSLGVTGAVFRHLQAAGFSGALVPTLPWGTLELGALGAVAVSAWFLARTHAGLVARACGENPEAVASAGTDPRWVRFATLAVAGGLVGVGGAALVLRGSGAFVEGMTAGRGFLALALVLIGRWRPTFIAFAAIVLAAATGVQFHLQGLERDVVPYQLLLALPYIATVIVLALVPADRLGGPAALGRPYHSQR